jgi:hypothetical protein
VRYEREAQANDSVTTRALRFFFAAWITGLIAAPAHASEVVADTRDKTTLFRPRLLTRQLFEQLAEPNQEHRIGRNLGPVAAAVDAQVASTQVLSGDFSRFHAFFIFDTFAALRSPYGFDFDLNLTLFNPSASDGVRVSSGVLPGGALHFYHELEVVPGKHARIDVLGTDLDRVTLGNGLLLEEWPLEGQFANLAYDGFYLRQYFGGRVFWPDDDLFTLSAGALDGKVEALFGGWTFREGSATAYYADLSAHWPLFADRVRVGAEFAANLRERARFGGLLRSDYTDRAAGLQWHLGYQFRWYQRGFGPRRGLATPSTTFNLPYREDAYFTNSFEFFAVSDLFEQWAHTAMLEVEVPLGRYFRAFAEGEVVAGYASGDGAEPALFLATPRAHQLPGSWTEGFYRGGLRLHPWPGLPHRLSAVFTNKQVQTGRTMADTTDLRLRTEGHYISLQLEASL